MMTKLGLLSIAIGQFRRMKLLYVVYKTTTTDYILPINIRILHEMTKCNDQHKIGTLITILSIIFVYITHVRITWILNKQLFIPIHVWRYFIAQCYPTYKVHQVYIERKIRYLNIIILYTINNLAILRYRYSKKKKKCF